MHIKIFLAFSCFLIVLTGCSFNDPNQNAKVRYCMARNHAKQALEEAGYSIDTYGNYHLMAFGRRYYDKSTKILHPLTLYDFLKVSPTTKPGPDRFVIVYDFVSRETYLRSNLRSNENIERLELNPAVIKKDTEK